MSPTDHTTDPDGLAMFASLGASAADAMTDDMVTRLAELVSQGMTLLDQVNRSGIDKALPVLASLTTTGDLAKLAEIPRVVAAVQDAMTDEMVTRLTELMSQTLTLLDRLARLQASGVLDRLLRAISALETLETLPPAKGGVSGLWAILTDRKTQEALRVLGVIGAALQPGR